MIQSRGTLLHRGLCYEFKQLEKATNGQKTALKGSVIKGYCHQQCTVFMPCTQASPCLRLIGLSSSLNATSLTECGMQGHLEAMVTPCCFSSSTIQT